MWWLALLIVVGLLLVALLQLGLWGSHGGLLAFLAGQWKPRSPEIERGTSVQVRDGLPGQRVQVTVDLSRPVGQVSPYYLSFALDVAQVVGGKWWNPGAGRAEWGSGTVPAPPIDLERPRLDLLARALAPAYLRIGGSESDKVYYDLHPGQGGPGFVPPGYQSTLTAKRWDTIHSFAERNGLDVIFTLNAGPGSRTRDGRWSGENASELIEYTARQGHRVAAWELGNELNVFYAVHGLGAQVQPRQYGQDLATARRLLDRYFKQARLAGQGSAFWPVLGEPLRLFFGYMPRYLQWAGSVVDAITWHYYPQQSRRGPMASRRACPARLLNPANLDEVAFWAAKIRGWRDRYAPGKPIWLGETGNAQFGGEPGISDVYIGGLWWLDQLGLSALQDQQVMVRQTLVGMDYGMLDEQTLTPRPDYWNSLLWKRLMGSQVYRVELASDRPATLRVYAHATPPSKGDGVSVLAINLDARQAAHLSFPGFNGYPTETFELYAADVLGPDLWLNGAKLELAADGALPEIQGLPSKSPDPSAILRPLSYTFFVFYRH